MKKVLPNIEAFEEAKKYWTSMFSDLNEETIIINDNPIKANDKKFGIYEINFDIEITNKIEHISNNNILSKFVLLLSGLSILFHKLNNQRKVLIVSPVLRDSNQDFNGFVPHLCSITHKMTFKELLAQLKETVIKAYKYQYFPVNKILEENSDGNASYFKNILFIDNLHKESVLNDDILLENNDILFHITKKDNDLICKIKYNANRYSKNSIESIFLVYSRILDSVLQNTNISISEINVLSQNEENKILQDFNNTTKEYQYEKTIHKIFEKKVLTVPNKTAIIYDNQKVSYDELNNYTNFLANSIIGRKHAVGLKICMLFDQSIEMIAAFLAILKLGNTYIPLSPDAPTKRNLFILDDCEADLILVQEKFLETHKEIISKMDKSKMIIASQFHQIIERYENPNVKTSEEDLAYIIYTSGTTGLPKGVKIKQKGIVNYSLWRIENYDLTSDDVALQLLTYQFDGYCSNLYSTILSGGSLILMPEENRLDAIHIINTFRQNGVTNLSITPGIYKIILDEQFENNHKLNSLRFVVIAGERASTQLLNMSQKLFPETVLYNEYGPTEASVASTGCRFDLNNSSIIGRPIANTSIFILNENNEIMPIGIKGEICIAGKGVSSGYVSNEKLTDEKFISTSFLAGKKIYKTGDLGKWLPNGDIEYLGRTDNQVKLQGYRIELGEIENGLRLIKNVDDAVVIVNEKNGNKYILAFYTAKSKLDSSELRNSLSERLPDYLIPHYFSHIESIPITSNGKLDRKELLQKEFENEEIYFSPENEVEEELVNIFEELLNIEKQKISVESNFFLLGGNSIKIMKLRQLINAKFGIEMNMVDLFKYNSIRKIAAVLMDDQDISSEIVHEETDPSDQLTKTLNILGNE